MSLFAIPDNQREFNRLYADGLTDKEIGEKMHINETTVAAYRRLKGLDGNGGTGRGGYRVNSTTRAGRTPVPGKAG